MKCNVSKHSSIKITTVSQGILGKNSFGISWCLSPEILSDCYRILDLWSAATHAKSFTIHCGCYSDDIETFNCKIFMKTNGKYVVVFKRRKFQ